MKKLSRRTLASLIDHTELRVDATYGDIRRLCLEAIRHGFASVVVYPVNVPLAAHLLKDTPVKVGTVVGFPTGAFTIEGKTFEIRDATAKGAQEVDFVINVGALKGGNHTLVQKEMQAMAHAAGDLVTNAILETCYLADDEKRVACRIASEAGIRFVKTSTGFGSGGATIEDVRLLCSAVSERTGVKASGGIRSTSDALTMVDAGASRVGTSSGVAIVEGVEA